MSIQRGWPQEDVTPRLKKAFAMADAIGMDDTERHELAQMIVGVDKDDGGSWKALTPTQFHDLITMLEGFLYCTEIISQRG